MFLKDAPDTKNVNALQAAITSPEVEKALRTRGTGRNWNTVLKLGALI